MVQVRVGEAGVANLLGIFRTPAFTPSEMGSRCSVLAERSYGGNSAVPSCEGFIWLLWEEYSVLGRTGRQGGKSLRWVMQLCPDGHAGPGGAKEARLGGGLQDPCSNGAWYDVVDSVGVPQRLRC